MLLLHFNTHYSAISINFKYTVRIRHGTPYTFTKRSFVLLQFNNVLFLRDISKVLLLLKYISKVLLR